MKRTTVSLPDELAQLLKREAQRRGASISGLVREALAAHLSSGDMQPRRLPFAALGASGEHHTARDLEEILAAEWDPAGDR